MNVQTLKLKCPAMRGSVATALLAGVVLAVLSVGGWLPSRGQADSGLRGVEDGAGVPVIADPFRVYTHGWSFSGSGQLVVAMGPSDSPAWIELADETTGQVIARLEGGNALDVALNRDRNELYVTYRTRTSGSLRLETRLSVFTLAKAGIERIYDIALPARTVVIVYGPTLFLSPDGTTLYYTGLRTRDLQICSRPEGTADVCDQHFLAALDVSATPATPLAEMALPMGCGFPLVTPLADREAIAGCMALNTFFFWDAATETAIPASFEPGLVPFEPEIGRDRERSGLLALLEGEDGTIGMFRNGSGFTIPPGGGSSKAFRVAPEGTYAVMDTTSVIVLDEIVLVPFTDGADLTGTGIAVFNTQSLEIERVIEFSQLRSLTITAHGEVVGVDVSGHLYSVDVDDGTLSPAGKVSAPATNDFIVVR